MQDSLGAVERERDDLPGLRPDLQAGPSVVGKAIPQFRPDLPLALAQARRGLVHAL